MSYDLIVFKSLDDLTEYISQRIEWLKERISELEGRRTVLRARAEKVRRLEEVLGKLVGGEVKSMNEVDLMGIKIIISARAVDELGVVEDTLEAMHDTLTALTRVREVMTQLAEEWGEASGLTLLVQTLNGIPVKILFKEEE